MVGLQCDVCDKLATIEVLDEFIIDYVDVCDDCYEDIFMAVAQSGAKYFHDWSEGIFGGERAEIMTKKIYGEDSLAEAGVNPAPMKQVYSGDEAVWMFTYGILKYPENLVQEGALEIVEDCILPGHKMHLHGQSFPITSKTGNDKDLVYGTLFKIPLDVVLTRYDFIEGYVPSAPAEKNLYNREQARIIRPDGEVQVAQMYYANQDLFVGDLHDDTLIPTGNFDDKHLASSYHAYSRNNVI